MKQPALPTRIAVHMAVVLAAAITLYPVTLVLKKAVEPGQQFALSPSPVPCGIEDGKVRCRVTTQHFRDVVRHPRFLRYALNSALLALGTTVVGVFLSCTAAYALSRFRFPGRRAGLAAFLVVQMFPSTLLLIPLYVLLNKLHLLNTLAGLVLVYATTAIPFCVWTLKGYFDTLPRELEEAARIDGASAWGVFFRVVLPLSRPAIAVTALFSFMTAWNEFILAGTFMTDERSYTLPVLLHNYIGEHHAEWGHFAAGAILTSLPVMALFYLLQRYLVGGLTAGAVKG
jgi:arabinogalactan oligomer / maltooligosaccharide transport system permease protein